MKPSQINYWPIYKRPLVLLNKNLRKAHRLFKQFPLMRYRTILDIGAHKGEFTIRAQPYFQTEKIWLVEADPNLAKELSANFTDTSKYKIICGAISDQSGKIRLRINSHADSSSILPINPISEKIFEKEMKEIGEIETTAFTLDDLFENEKIKSIDLMKVDIQGAEKLMILGGKNALKKVKTIYIEVVFEEFYKGCATFTELNSLLLVQGFKVRSFHESRLGSDGALAYANALYINPERLL